MKIYTLLFLVFISAVIHAQTLIAYYPLNGNAKDSSGNHFDGVVRGGVTLTTDRNSNANSAAMFNGVDGRIDVADTPALRPASFTVSTWFYFSEIPSNYKIIVAKNLCKGFYESFALYLDNTGHLLATISNGVAGEYMSYSAPVIGKWHFATMTFDHDQGLLKLYVDGSLVNVINTNIQVAYDNNSFAIGYELENCKPNYFFNGKIDEVRFYNGALSNKQVSQLFDSTMHRPGSGTALQCDGQSNYVALPQTVLEKDRIFTIEYWIKTTENRSSSVYYQRPTMIGNVTYGDASGDFGITTDSGRVGMWGGLNSAPDDVILTNTKINDNKWHHIAAVSNGAHIFLYVDGVLQEGSLQSARRLTVAYSFYIGASHYGASGAYFFHEGQYDEVRIWDEALTKQQIKDRMCHKITSSDSLYSHLVAYYNFDETNTIIAFDIAHYNNAFLVNSPHRVESDAPIGDTSADVYGNGLKTVSINALSGETFTVNSTSGRTSGLHVYVVNESPQYLRGVDTLCNQNKYFGVFQANDKQDVYSAVYNYAANPCVNASNENSLRVYQKPGPDSNYWYQLPYVPNTTLNTITINDVQEYNAKFILGLDTASSFTTAGKNNAATGKHLFNASLFPNPASSQLGIYINNEACEFHLNKATLQVTNIAGNILITKEVGAFGKQNMLQLNVSQLTAGSYVLKIISSDGNVKMVKQFIKE